MDIHFDQAIQSALEFYQAGDLERSKSVCTEVLKKLPDSAEVLYFLGVIYFELGNYNLAIEHIEKAVLFNPINADAYHFLGMAFQEKGQIDKAIFNYRKTIDLDPDYSEAYNNLGNMLKEKGLLDESLSNYQKAAQLNPGLAVAYRNIGVCLKEKGMIDEAILYYQKAIDVDPSYAATYNLLGIAFKEKDDLDKATSAYRNALTLDPCFAEAHSNLGSILQMRGKLDEAEVYYRRAIKMRQGAVIPHQNLLFALLFNYRHTSRYIFLEHLRFSQQFETPLRSTIVPHINDKTIDRKLRIGYVSPDFKKHSVAYFFEPVLASYNREQFEVFCYSTVLYQDEITQRMRGYSDHWRIIAELPDEQASDLIRSDGIDILVDLAGHTAYNRLLLFARKPAPVQVSWIGYPPTTGLSSMDYKIVDAYTDPPEITDRFYSEKLMRLPDSLVCYLPDRESPEVGPLPAFSAGHITFGSFNNFPKVTPMVLELWAKILNSIPGSRLIMKSKIFFDKGTCRYVTDIFTQRGIIENRITFQSTDPAPRHLKSYNLVDIGLDTFPFNGLTTTCEAMWMGVPVITLASTGYAARAGVSLLSNVGLTKLIAKTHDEYISIAVNLAKDLKRLQSLREHLRDIMMCSPLTNAKRFVLDLENSYRSMWVKWCGQKRD